MPSLLILQKMRLRRAHGGLVGNKVLQMDVKGRVEAYSRLFALMVFLKELRGRS